ncbi:MAG: TIGR02391 family protein [Faecalibacterium sp.]
MDDIKNKIYKLSNWSVENRDIALSNQLIVQRADFINIKKILMDIAYYYGETRPVYKDQILRIAENLFQFKDGYIIVVNIIFAQLYMLLQLINEELSLKQEGVWGYIHPKIVEISKKNFEIEDYAGAVQLALVEICSIVREYREAIGAKEILSDKDMMLNTFSTQKYITFTDSSNATLRAIQEGYEHLFAGSIQAWRNPNAHKNNKLEKEDAMRKLMLASDLMYKLEEALRRTVSSGGA